MFPGVFVYGVVVLSALLSAAFFSRLFRVDPPQGRIGPVDGLRGFLALGVFAYHFGLWREVLQGQYWGAPVSYFEYQLGKVGVSFFFMITAFLFCRKVVFSDRVDWRSLYVGRLFRIYPLYIFVVLLISAMAFLRTGELQVSLAELLTSLGRWMIFDQPPINGYEDTRQLVAGVVWTLAYELVYYLFLPALALIAGKRVPLWALVLPVLAVIYAHAFGMSLRGFASFFAGMAAAFLIDRRWFSDLARTQLADVLVLGCVLVALLVPVPGDVIFVGGAFCLIAGGCSLGGLLTRRLTRTLGEVTYSIYLLHGIVLSALIYFVIGQDAAAQIPEYAYNLLAAPVTFILVGCSFWAFKYVEAPGMQLGAKYRTGQAQAVQS